MTYLKLHVELLKLLILCLFLLLSLAVYTANKTTETPSELSKKAMDHTVQKYSEIALIGKSLFRSNCATCHNKNMVDNLTGPALAKATEDWKAFPKEDLYRWINNPSKLAEEGHQRAVLLFKEWKPVEMTAFPNMTKPEIDAIFAYVDEVVN